MASLSPRSGRPSSRWCVSRPGRITGTILLVLALAGGPLLDVPAAAAADLIVVSDGTTATLPPRASAIVSFPLTAAPGVPLDPAPEVAVQRVLLDKEQLDVAGAVEPWITAAVPALELRVSTDRLATPGAYEILLSVTRGDQRQLVTVTLTRPPGRVVTPATVTVKRTLPLLPGGTTEERLPRLTVFAASGTRLVTMSAFQVEPDDPQIRVGTVAVPVEPGGHTDVPYTVAGTAGPGTVTRTVQISSPQLSDPVPVTFSVTTRRHPGLIAVFLILGVLLGLAVRTLLPRAAAWRAREIDRRQLEADLTSLAGQYPDEEFGAFLAERRAALHAARGAGVTTTAAAIRTAVAQRLEALQAELTGLDDRYRAPATILRSDWRLPASLADGVGAARAALARADAALDARNRGGARDALTDVDRAVDDLVREAGDWGALALAGLTDLANALGDRDKGSLGQLRTAVLLARSGVPVSAVASPATTADLARRLREADQTVQRFAALRPYLNGVAEEADLLAKTLAEHQQDVADLTAATRSARAGARAAGDDPATAAEPLARVISELVTAEQDAIRRPLRAAQEPAVDAMLASGDMAGALQVVLGKLGTTTAPTSPVLLGDEATTIMAATRTVSEATPVPQPRLAILPNRSPARDRWNAASRGIVLAVAGAGVLLVHTLVAVAIVLLVGYGLFLSSWTGTLNDVTTILVWAFAVDVSIAGLSALLTPTPARAG
ncbi:hypothetical protein ACTOB_005218 [Actinoplanes oblitus]|uniref:Uncharacterized protein n=1 Tax=Actinoplanes oblitus TaxID=3040509 RepID=A0ABY8W8K5_9ACTN|nr:hypothetical protein [Actinoplanes oblitus]WIM93245.1 hypothetical protein ACTOB_005218 [Actinoplanes oblitus]